MSQPINVANLTLVYTNTSNNNDSLQTNITDICNNLLQSNNLFTDILYKLNLSYSDVSNIRSQLIDISNNI